MISETVIVDSGPLIALPLLSNLVKSIECSSA